MVEQTTTAKLMASQMISRSAWSVHRAIGHCLRGRFVTPCAVQEAGSVQ